MNKLTHSLSVLSVTTALLVSPSYETHEKVRFDVNTCLDCPSIINDSVQYELRKEKASLRKYLLYKERDYIEGFNFDIAVISLSLKKKQDMDLLLSLNIN